MDTRTFLLPTVELDTSNLKQGSKMSKFKDC
jgi:hypothetical protein